MSTQNTVVNIRSALNATNNGEFAASSTTLLAIMGYRSDRIPADQTGNCAGFLRGLPGAQPRYRFGEGIWGQRRVGENSDAVHRR